MAKLTNIKRIFKEQFPPEVQKWIDQLLYPLNNAIAQFSFALNNNLTLKDNFVGSTKTLTITGSSNITGDMTSGASTMINCRYYQYNAPNINPGYGIQTSLPVQGIGVPPGTKVQSISGTNIVLSQPCTATQTGAKVIVGGAFPVTFQHDLASRPTILLLDSCLETTASPPIFADGVFIDWYVNGNDIIIRNITGLAAGRSYTITVTALAG